MWYKPTEVLSVQLQNSFTSIHTSFIRMTHSHNYYGISCNFVIDSKEPQEPHKKAAASWCYYWTLSLSSYVTTHNHASAYWIGGRTKMNISISCVTKDQILASKSLQIIDRRNYSQTLCLIYHSISLYRLQPSILEWPALWRIMMNSLHNEGMYKWVN